MCGRSFLPACSVSPGLPARTIRFQSPAADLVHLWRHRVLAQAFAGSTGGGRVRTWRRQGKPYSGKSAGELSADPPGVVGGVRVFFLSLALSAAGIPPRGIEGRGFFHSNANPTTATADLDAGRPSYLLHVGVPTSWDVNLESDRASRATDSAVINVNPFRLSGFFAWADPSCLNARLRPR